MMLGGLPEEVRYSSHVNMRRAPTVYLPANRAYLADGVEHYPPCSPDAGARPRFPGRLVVTPDAPTVHADRLEITINPAEARRVDMSHRVGSAAACAAAIATALVVVFSVMGVGAIVSASIGCAAALVCMTAQMANVASFKSATLLMSPEADISAIDTTLTVTTRRSERLRAGSLAIGAALLGATNTLLLITAIAGAGPFASAVLLGVLGFCAMMLPDVLLVPENTWAPYRVQFTG